MKTADWEKNFDWERLGRVMDFTDRTTSEKLSVFVRELSSRAKEEGFVAADAVYDGKRIRMEMANTPLVQIMRCPVSLKKNGVVAKYWAWFWRDGKMDHLVSGWKTDIITGAPTVKNPGDWKDHAVIYGICHGRRLFYVGQSLNSASRLQNHLSCRGSGSQDGSLADWETEYKGRFRLVILHHEKFSGSPAQKDRINKKEAALIKKGSPRMFNQDPLLGEGLREDFQKGSP